MTRIPRTATVVALLALGASSAHAEMLNVSMVAQDHSPFSLSFDLNTAATTDTISTGSCGNGEASGVYTNFSATGGISNASLLWNGVSYSLQSSDIFLDNQGDCVYDMDMRLTLNNNTAFVIDDVPTRGGFSYSEYNPSQMLTTAMLSGYNNYYYGALETGGEGGFGGAVIIKTTAVPEPGTLALFAVGLAGLALSRRRIKA